MDQDGVLRDHEKGTKQMKRQNGIEDNVNELFSNGNIAFASEVYYI